MTQKKRTKPKKPKPKKPTLGKKPRSDITKLAQWQQFIVELFYASESHVKWFCIAMAAIYGPPLILSKLIARGLL